MRKRIWGDLPFYAAALVLVLVSYVLMNRDMELLLLPHRVVMEYLYGMDFVFVGGLGYQQVDGLFVITQGCSGMKMFVSLFLIMVLGFLHRYVGMRAKIGALAVFFPVALLLSFMLTIVRIGVSVPFVTWERFYLIHNIMSLGLYFAAGLGLYFAMTRMRLGGGGGFVHTSAGRRPVRYGWWIRSYTSGLPRRRERPSQ